MFRGFRLPLYNREMPILISKDAALSELAAVLSHMPQNTVASNPPFQAWRQRALIVLGTGGRLFTRQAI